MKKIFLMFLSLFVLFIIINAPVIFQEGNPIPLAVGIAKLHTTDQSVVKIDGENKRYVTKADSQGNQPFLDLMSSKKWVFKEQAGAGLFFTKGEKELIVESEMYTSKYKIYTLD
ncbi:hypothetical protein [Pseudobacillus badius]|uniref:hypothetical protein n=1 Tax=Bacillus badius TaxID=1455 RepID=UPI0007B331A3|nr:hypothetical protein [Bacillus badius]KZR60088.1 hypothetical protein A3781_07760 [Bacillus badius]